MARILYVLPVDWHELTQRFHHVATRLAARHDVTVMGPRSHRRLLAAHDYRGLLSPYSDTPLGTGIVRSVPTLPGYRLHPSLVRRQWGTYAQRLARAAPGRIDILWIADGTLDDLPARVPHDTLVYECVDDHAGFWHAPGLADELRRREHRLTGLADVVLATAPALVDRLAPYAQAPVHLVANGVDLAVFEAVAASPERFARPGDLVASGRATVGYYGAIGDWLDGELVTFLATQRPDVDFVFIGPDLAGWADSLKPANVKLLGSKPYDALPAYLAHVGTWIIPFSLTPMTLAVDPLKAYEYLAAGRQVVSARLPALVPLASVIRLADTPAAWLAEVDAAIAAGPRSSLPPAAAAQLAARDWDRLTAEVEGLVTGLAPRNAQP